MCAIFGYLGPRGERFLELGVTAAQKLRHRGPDGEGFVWLSEQGALEFAGADTPSSLCLPSWQEVASKVYGSGVLLGHRRLSILDITASGHQPMSDPSCKVWISYNGEVYNFKELRAELATYYNFSTGTDTEVILKAYLHYGPNVVKRFVGMFAIAIADYRDSANPILLLARDPFGIKPLYYTVTDSTLCFASELKTLLPLLHSRTANPTVLHRYLESGVPDAGVDTMVQGIRRLQAGCIALFSVNAPATPHLQQYWRPTVHREISISRSEAAEQIRHLLLKSVDLHLRSDVPVGAALSGGIDSSCIVTAMNKVNTSIDLRTFSYISSDDRLNEEKWVDMVALKTGAKMEKVALGHEHLRNEVDRLIRIQEEPFSDTSIYAQFCVFRLAKNANIKVTLDGQGADEIFGGYPQFSPLFIAALIQIGKFAEAFKVSRSAYLLGRSSNNFWAKALQELIPSACKRTLRSFFFNSSIESSLNKSWFLRYGMNDGFGKEYQGESRHLAKGLAVSITETSLPSLLRYSDRNSMTHSVESRVPFLTTELCDLALSLPEHYLIDLHGVSKSILREAMQGIVPTPILERKDKIGFATPEKLWLEALQPWMEGYISSDVARSIPALDQAGLLKQWQLVACGKLSYDHRFWRWINTIAWTEQFEIVYDN